MSAQWTAAIALAGLGIVDGVLSETGPEAVPRVRAALIDALATAQVGDRDRRLAGLTRRYLGHDLSTLTASAPTAQE